MAIANKIKSNILPFITIALLAINLLLVYQNVNLRSRLNPVSPKRIKKGDLFVISNVADFAKDSASSFENTDNNKKQIFLYFHPNCGYCKKQMPYWKDLVSKVDSARYQIIPVTTETNQKAVQQFLADYGCESWKVLTVSQDSASKANLLGTPTTVSVDNKGKVEEVWEGLWQSKEIESADEYFAINLSKP